LKTGTIFLILAQKLKPSMPANIKSIELRNLQIEDYKQLKNSMIESYPEMEESFWREDQIILLLAKFPEGQLVIVVDGIVVGSALSLLVTEDFAFKTRSYKAITGNFTFSTHNLMEKFYTELTFLLILNIEA
jgi:hypothetical protein